MIQYQILRNDNMRIVWQTVRRITDEILGVEVLKFFCNHVLYCRLTFTPNQNVVRLTRKVSYTPDPELEQEVQEMLSNKEHEEERRLEKINETVNGGDNDVAKSPKEYLLTDLKPRRSRMFRSSVYIKVKAGEGRARDRVVRRVSDDDS